MQVKLKTSNLDKTPSIEEYVEKKMDTFGSLVQHPDATLCEVEIAFLDQDEPHFYAEINLSHGNDVLRATAEHPDVYAAIDAARDELKGSLIRHKDKKQTLLRKGQRLFKRMLQGGE